MVNKELAFRKIRNKKNQAGGGKTAPRFSLRRRNLLPAWKTHEPRFQRRGYFFKINPIIRSNEESNLGGCDHTSAPLAN
jgi:hypothetical protein